MLPFKSIMNYHSNYKIIFKNNTRFKTLVCFTYVTHRGYVCCYTNNEGILNVESFLCSCNRSYNHVTVRTISIHLKRNPGVFPR